MKSKFIKIIKLPGRILRWSGRSIRLFWLGRWWKKLIIIIAAFLIVSLGAMYGISRWYMASVADKPLLIGTSFVPAYAESLGVQPKPTLDALINDAGVRNFRLVGYWSQLEPSDGHYDFSLLDWQFKKIEASGGTISLALGLRQPRWPECHMPGWAENLPDGKWQPKLSKFIAAVVKRYKSSPALISYQLENEYFLKAFGQCTNFDRQRLVNEFNLVKRLDPSHPVIVSRSNNGIGVPLGQPRPDESAISLYRRVWNTKIYTGYFSLPTPAWYYGFLAGVTKIMTGKDTIIHELQAEPWPPNSQPITDTSLTEQDKSFNAERFKDTIKFGKDTGMRQVYLWGGEYWYYRKALLHDSSVWNEAKQIFKNN